MAGKLKIRADSEVNTGKTRKQEQSRDRSRGKNTGRLDELATDKQRTQV